jgi:CDP-diacylglycerol--glycerol-3-phosphate 3-phosphatidyltransferase
MMLQVVGVALVLLSIRWPELRLFALTAMWAVVVFGLASAVDYFRKFWRKVDTGIKLRRRNELIMMERQKRRLQRAQKGQEEKRAIRRSG